MRTHVSISPAATPTPPRRRPRALTRLLAAFTLLLAPALPSLAQQLPNSSFENDWVDCIPWTSGNNSKTKGQQPNPWTISHVIGMSGTGATEVGGKASEGYNSATSVLLYGANNSVASSQIVPGFITLGTSWATSTGTGDNKDGGTWGGMDFTSRPDAIHFMYKREGSVDEDGSIIAYGWKGTWQQKDVPAENSLTGSFLGMGGPSKVTMQNRERNILGISTVKGGTVSKSDDAELIFKINTTIGKQTKWTHYIGEFEYSSQAKPQMINVIISATNYWNDSPSAGNNLYVDDVQLAWFSHLKKLSVKGRNFEVSSNVLGENGIINLSYPGYLNEIDITTDIITECDGNSGSVEAPQISKDEENNRIVITVSNPSGEDIDGYTSHTYYINCYEPEITGISINNVSLTPLSAMMSFNGYLVDFTDAQIEVSHKGFDGETIVSRNKTNHTITISMPEGVYTTKTKDFVIQCLLPKISEITIGNTNINLEKLTYGDYLANITDDMVMVTMPGVAEDTPPVITRNNDANTLTISLPTGIGNTAEGESSYTIQCWIPVNDIIFPEDMPSTMETSDEYTLNLSDFIFEPDGAAETSITMVEIFSIEGVDDGKTGAILTNNVTNYVLKAVDPCTVTIRATSTNGKTKDASVVISPKPLKNITFSDEAYSIVQNLERTFTANNLIFDPENAYDLGFAFSVEGNNNFAWVENNSDWTEMTIFGINMGDFKICATSTANPEIKAEAPISISDQLVLPRVVTLADNFTLPSPMYIGETNNFKIQIKYLAIGGALVNVNVTPEWTSNNTDILTIDNDGNVALAENVILQPGQQVTVNLKVEAKYNNENDEPQSVSNNWDIIVRQPVTAIDWQDSKGVKATTISMKEHETPSALAVITPENASDLNITYTIEGDGDAKPIISYDETTGIITANGFGTNTIVAHATDFGHEDETRKGKEARLTVKVAAMPKTITIREAFDRKQFWVGKDYTLTAAILPVEAAAASLKWESSDPEVIAVDEDGVISVLKVGTANISATAENGESKIISITGEEYKGLTRDFKGVMTVTDAEGTVSRDENTTITLTTTSDEDLDLSIASLTIKGLPIKNIAATGLQYEAVDVDPETNVPAMIKIFDTNSHNIKLMNGYIDANVTIDGESKFDLSADTAMVKINIVVVNWENEKASAVFSSSGSTGTVTPEDPKDPEDPEEPEEPVVGEGTKTVYPGKISFSVVASDENGDDEEGTAESFVVKTVVTVIDPRPDKTEAHNVDIKIPDLHFGEIDWDMWSSRASFDEEAENYLYNFHAMTLKGVTASTAGNTVKYEFSGTATADDDETITYSVTLKGTANTQNGDARIQLTIMDPVSGEELGGAFANSEDEGDIYSGKLTINMGGTDLTEGDGQDATVNIIPSADGLTATFLLPNFTLEGIGALGDIRVDDVEVSNEDDGSTWYYGSVQGMQLLGGAIVADVNLEGYVDADGYAEMTIYVVWSGINIECHFNGKRTAGGNTTGIEAVESATDAPAIYFTIRGIRAAEPLAPGLYIERRGSKARKIIVR